MIAMIEFVGPCRFSHWATEDDLEEHFYLQAGDPVARDNPTAWIQIAAVSKDQTRNTMTLFPGLISPELKSEHLIDLGKEIIYAYHGQRRIEAVTSSPRALEGGRPTFVIQNEALALDTPIPTPSGWTTMGDLRDGHTIFGEDGRPTVVTKAHPVQEGRRCFRVTFGEGDSVVASDGHWWQTRVANNRRCTMKRRTTLEMYEAGRQFWLPDLAVLDCSDADLPVDPYILGLWLGDGHSASAQIACDARDIDEVAAEMTRLGVRKVAKTGEGGLHLGLSDTTRGGRPTGYKGLSVQSQLRRLGVLGNKHIPDAYLRASAAQRLALLQGLMDSDGSIRPDGNARFCNANPRLIEGTRDLLLGLGYQCQEPTWQTRDAGRWPDRAHWQPMGFISFVAYDERNPFRLTRKAKYARSGPVPVRSRKIAKIEEIESVPVRCISVSVDGSVAERGEGTEQEAVDRYYSSQSRLFLAGRGMHATAQTHHWLVNNEGHAMAGVIDRNATKAKGGQARTLSITNAYEPSEDSVAQQEREAYEAEATGQAISTGVLYDSLEAPPGALLHPGGDATDDEVKSYIGAVIRAVRGDATWLDVEGIVSSILDRKNPPSRSRRFWYNQIVASEDAWLDPRAVDLAVDPVAKDERMFAEDQLRAGWLATPDEEIVMFLDCSKSDDSTALVGCRLEDGYVFTLGVWQKPPGDAGKGWIVPRESVDARVHEVMDRFTVRAFWGDPSHTKDDDETRFWDPLFDAWHRQYREQLSLWAVKFGDRAHSVMWDMTSPDRHAQFVAAAELFAEEIQTEGADGYASPFTHDGHPALVEHLKNARRYPTRVGVSLWKGHRESARKVDLAVCAVGARLLRRLVLNRGPDETTATGKSAGEVWW